MRAGDYTFFNVKENENQLGTGFFLHHRRILAIKGVEFVTHGMSYIVLRGRWCTIIVLNVHAPTQEKSDDSKDSFCEELEQGFHHLPKYHTKILLGDFNAEVERDNIFKSTNGNESLHQDSNNNNGVGLINFASKINSCKEQHVPAPKRS